jgi:hypothetical protein
VKGYADGDHPTYRRISNRRERDLAFLAAVRAATTLAELRALRRVQPQPIPAWRHVALMRAVKRVCVAP